MITNVIIEFSGTIDDEIVKEIQNYNGHVSLEKYLSGIEIVTTILLPIVSVGIEKTLSLLIDKIGISKDTITIKYKGKVYKDLDLGATKQLIKLIEEDEIY